MLKLLACGMVCFPAVRISSQGNIQAFRKTAETAGRRHRWREVAVRGRAVVLARDPAVAVIQEAAVRLTTSWVEMADKRRIRREGVGPRMLTRPTKAGIRSAR